MPIAIMAANQYFIRPANKSRYRRTVQALKNGWEEFIAKKYLSSLSFPKWFSKTVYHDLNGNQYICAARGGASQILARVRKPSAPVWRKRVNPRPEPWGKNVLVSIGPRSTCHVTPPQFSPGNLSALVRFQ